MSVPGRRPQLQGTGPVPPPGSSGKLPRLSSQLIDTRPYGRACPTRLQQSVKTRQRRRDNWECLQSRLSGTATELPDAISNQTVVARDDSTVMSASATFRIDFSPPTQATDPRQSPARDARVAHRVFAADAVLVGAIDTRIFPATSGMCTSGSPTTEH